MQLLASLQSPVHSHSATAKVATLASNRSMGNRSRASSPRRALAIHETAPGPGSAGSYWISRFRAHEEISDITVHFHAHGGKFAAIRVDFPAVIPCASGSGAPASCCRTRIQASFLRPAQPPAVPDANIACKIPCGQGIRQQAVSQDRACSSPHTSASL
jgi:hypothetical protein